MLRQFKMAIKAALVSNHETRTMMRARSSLQLFLVAQWMEDLEILHSTSIKLDEQNKLLAAKNTSLKTFQREIAEVMEFAAFLPHKVSSVISRQIHSIDLALRSGNPQDSLEERPGTLSERARRASNAAEEAFALDFCHLRKRPPITSDVTEEEIENEDIVASEHGKVA